MMNGSKSCGPSDDFRAPSLKRTRPGPRVSCPPSPHPSPSGRYVFSGGRDGALRRPRPRSSGWNEYPRDTAIRRVAPLHAARTSQRDVPTTLNTHSRRGRNIRPCLIIRPSLVVLCLRNERQRSGDCNRNVRLFQHRANALPLLGERVGLRGNEANSNPRRTTIPGTVKLREFPSRAGGFPT